LIGDAAFVARPHVGMGVTKAMQDALALEAGAAPHGATPQALQAYADIRAPAGQQVVRARPPPGRLHAGLRPGRQHRAGARRAGRDGRDRRRPRSLPAAADFNEERPSPTMNENTTTEETTMAPPSILTCRAAACCRPGAAGAALSASPFAVNIVRAQGANIKIGFLVPQTGAYAAEARDQVRAAEIAIKDFNDAGGFNGRKAELLVRDDKLNPGEAATRTLELIEKDKADFIVGSLSAATQLSMNAVTRERKVIFNSISQSDAINEAKDWSPYTFHEALNPHITSGAVARYAFPKYGKRIVYLTADYAYGHEMVRGFERAGKALRRDHAGGHPPPDRRGRLLRLPAAHPGAQARHPGAVQLRPRPHQLLQAGHRLRPEGDHPHHHAGAGADGAHERRRRRLRRRGRRHLLLLGHGEHHPGGQGLQRQVPQGLRRRGALRLRRARLCRRAQRAAGRAGCQVDRVAEGQRRHAAA
jgi:hypothetical protein